MPVERAREQAEQGSQGSWRVRGGRSRRAPGPQWTRAQWDAKAVAFA